MATKSIAARVNAALRSAYRTAAVCEAEDAYHVARGCEPGDHTSDALRAMYVEASSPAVQDGARETYTYPDGSQLAWDTEQRTGKVTRRADAVDPKPPTQAEAALPAALIVMRETDRPATIAACMATMGATSAHYVLSSAGGLHDGLFGWPDGSRMMVRIGERTAEIVPPVAGGRDVDTEPARQMHMSHKERVTQHWLWRLDDLSRDTDTLRREVEEVWVRASELDIPESEPLDDALSAIGDALIALADADDALRRLATVEETVI